MSIINDILTTYEPETETNEQLNERIAELNKQLIQCLTRLEIKQDIIEMQNKTSIAQNDIIKLLRDNNKQLAKALEALS